MVTLTWITLYINTHGVKINNTNLNKVVTTIYIYILFKQTKHFSMTCIFYLVYQDKIITTSQSNKRSDKSVDNITKGLVNIQQKRMFRPKTTSHMSLIQRVSSLIRCITYVDSGKLNGCVHVGCLR